MLTVAPLIGLCLFSASQNAPDWNAVLKELQPQLRTTSSASALLSKINSSLKSKGVIGNPSSPPFRPSGTQDWVFALLGQENMEGIVVLATPTKAGYSIEELMPANADSIMPMSGFGWNGEFVFGGLIGWFGNGPSAAAMVLSRGPNGWKSVQKVSSNFEAWECNFKRQGGRWVAKIDGRTYPKNISVPHVMADVQMTQQFVFSGGKLSAGAAKRTANPMAVLDDLAGAAAAHQLSAIQKCCLNASLAKQVNALGSAMKEAHWDTPSNTKDVGDSEYIATNLGLKFVFVKHSGRWILGAVKSVPKSD